MVESSNSRVAHRPGPFGAIWGIRVVVGGSQDGVLAKAVQSRSSAAPRGAVNSNVRLSDRPGRVAVACGSPRDAVAHPEFLEFPSIQ